MRSLSGTAKIEDPGHHPLRHSHGSSGTGGSHSPQADCLSPGGLEIIGDFDDQNSSLKVPGHRQRSSSPLWDRHEFKWEKSILVQGQLSPPSLRLAQIVRKNMNQRGDVNLFFVLFVAGLSGVMILCALRLQRSFHLLEKRTELFLCVKETEGELSRYMKFMGRTNWAIKNIEKAKLIMMFIPGLQGGALEAEKAKRTLILLQNTGLIPYLKKTAELKSKGCPLDPRLLITPFELSGSGYQRETAGSAKLRKTKWTNQYLSSPYALSVEWDASGLDSLNPKLLRKSWESGAKLSSILSSY